MAEADGVLSWNIEEIAQALKISEEDVKNYFTDGRRVSFILERRIAREILNGELASNEGEEYDIEDSEGRRWEVRSISKRGVYFCPSHMIGSGRSFDEQGFLEKLERIEGYIIADIESFPNIPFWKITADEVKKWWNDKELGKTTKISREKALELIKCIKRDNDE
jgi:hypothetical protein